MQSLLEKFRLHVSSERRRRREKKLPYRFRFAYVSFYFFHFRTLSYFLIKFDTSESFFFAFYVSFRFFIILFWCFVGMGKKIYLCWTAEGRNKVSKIKVRFNFKRYKSKQFYFVKLIKCPSKLTDIQNKGYFMIFFKHQAFGQSCWLSICLISSGQY